MNIAEIESSLKELVETPFDTDAFIFRFLEICDAPKATVTVCVSIKPGRAFM